MDYKQIKLENGLRVIGVPMASTQAMTLVVLVGVGSRFESKEKSGVSHFLEHMFFKGTKHRPEPGLVHRDLDRIGAQHNAFTLKETTGYWVKADASHWGVASDVVSDILLESLFPEKEIAKERGVILQEMNMYMDLPMRYISDIYEELLYGDTPLGRFIIGNEKSLLSITRDDLVSYWQTHYGAENMVVVAAGKIGDKELQDLESRFKNVARAPAFEAEKAAHDQTEARLRIEQKKSDQTHFMIGVRAFDKYSDDRYALGLLSIILGGNTSSRLWMEIRERRGLAYYLKAETELYRDTGSFAIRAGIPHDKLQEVSKCIIEEFSRAKEKGVTDEELKYAKEYVHGSTILELETSDALAGLVAEQAIFYKEILSPSEILKKYDAVTRDDIVRVAQALFENSRLNMAVIGPHEGFDKSVLTDLTRKGLRATLVSANVSSKEERSH